MITSIERFQTADGSVASVATGDSSAASVVGCEIGNVTVGMVRWTGDRAYTYELTPLQGRMVEAGLSIGESMGQVANFIKRFGTNPMPVVANGV